MNKAQRAIVSILMVCAGILLLVRIFSTSGAEDTQEEKVAEAKETIGSTIPTSQYLDGGLQALREGPKKFLEKIKEDGWDINNPSQVHMFEIVAPADGTWSTEYDLDAISRQIWNGAPYDYYYGDRTSEYHVQNRRVDVPFHPGATKKLGPHPILKLRNSASSKELHWTIVMCNLSAIGAAP